MIAALVFIAALQAPPLEKKSYVVKEVGDVKLEVDVHRDASLEKARAFIREKLK